MKTKILLLAAIVCSLSSCKFLIFKPDKDSTVAILEHTLVEKEYDVDAFDSIELNGGFQIYYSSGGDSIKISAPEIIIDSIEIKTENNTLSIKYKDGTSIQYPNDVKIFVKSNKLNTLNVTGACFFQAANGISSDIFNACVIGKGNIRIDGLVADTVSIKADGSARADINKLQCTGISAVINGAGSITLGGKAESAKLTINGAGVVDVRKLDCENISSSVNGAGKIKQ